MKLKLFLITVLLFSPFQMYGQTSTQVVSSNVVSTDSQTITTLSGKTYNGCTVVKTEPDGITIIDSDGGAKIFFSDLSPSLQTKYGYDPIKAKEYTDKVQSDTKQGEIQEQKFAELKRKQQSAQNTKDNDSHIAELKREMDAAKSRLESIAGAVNQDVRTQNGTYVSSTFANGGNMPPQMKQYQADYLQKKAAYDLAVSQK